jgi:hypothetical protein
MKKIYYDDLENITFLYSFDKVETVHNGLLFSCSSHPEVKMYAWGITMAEYKKLYCSCSDPLKGGNSLAQKTLFERVVGKTNLGYLELEA